MNIEPASFPGGVWDGLNYQFTTLDHDKNPDFHSKDRITSEIQAIESYLIGFAGIFLKPFSPDNAVVTVRDDNTGLSYRSLVGDGIEITYTDDEIRLKSLGRWSEQVENDSGITVTIGHVVCLKTTGKFTLAQADDFLTSEILGLVADTSIVNGSIGKIQITGPLTTTTIIWDTITGQIGGLVPNSVYYLSDSIPGKLTDIPPNTINSCLVRVGKALSLTKLLIYPNEPITL